MECDETHERRWKCSGTLWEEEERKMTMRMRREKKKRKGDVGSLSIFFIIGC